MFGVCLVCSSQVDNEQKNGRSLIQFPAEVVISGQT